MKILRSFIFLIILLKSNKSVQQNSIKKILGNSQMTSNKIEFKKQTNKKSESFSKKKFNKPPPRKLQMGDPPPEIFHEFAFMPTSIPQITAPRMTLRNFTKPTPVDYLLKGWRPTKVTMSKQSRGANEEVINHSTPFGRRLLQQNKKNKQQKMQNDLKLFERRLQNKKIHKNGTRKSRKLLADPYINIQNSSVDIGSHGYSKLSYALLNPQAESMGPFIPRTSPPPPIRIQVRDIELEKATKQLVTDEERDYFKLYIKELEDRIERNIEDLQVETNVAKEELAEGLENLRLSAHTLKEKRDEKIENTHAFEEGLKQKISKQLSAFQKVTQQLTKVQNSLKKNKKKENQKKSENSLNKSGQVDKDQGIDIFPLNVNEGALEITQKNENGLFEISKIKSGCKNVVIDKIEKPIEKTRI